MNNLLAPYLIMIPIFFAAYFFYFKNKVTISVKIVGWYLFIGTLFAPLLPAISPYNQTMIKSLYAMLIGTLDYGKPHFIIFMAISWLATVIGIIVGALGIIRGSEIGRKTVVYSTTIAIILLIIPFCIKTPFLNIKDSGLIVFSGIIDKILVVFLLSSSKVKELFSKPITTHYT